MTVNYPSSASCQICGCTRGMHGEQVGSNKKICYGCGKKLLAGESCAADMFHDFVPQNGLDVVFDFLRTFTRRGP